MLIISEMITKVIFRKFNWSPELFQISLLGSFYFSVQMRLPRSYRAELDVILSEPFLYLIAKNSVPRSVWILWTGKRISSTIFSRNKIVFFPIVHVFICNIILFQIGLNYKIQARRVNIFERVVCYLWETIQGLGVCHFMYNSVRRDKPTNRRVIIPSPVVVEPCFVQSLTGEFLMSRPPCLSSWAGGLAGSWVNF